METLRTRIVQEKEAKALPKREMKKEIPLAGNPILENNCLSLSFLTGSLSLLVIIHHTTRLLFWIALDLDREGATA